MNQGSPNGTQAQFEVVWPLGKCVTASVRAAPALADLNGKTVGLLWNWGFRGDEIYSTLTEELLKTYPAVRILDQKVFGTTHGPDERQYVAELPALLQQHGCDAVISAVGA